MLWDTAGQEEFDAITAAYYRGAHACVLAYSATDRDSFDAIPSWKLKVRSSLDKFIIRLPVEKSNYWSSKDKRFVYYHHLQILLFFPQVENECGEIPTVLVQNKIDLVDQCVIDP